LKNSFLTARAVNVFYFNQIDLSSNTLWGDSEREKMSFWRKINFPSIAANDAFFLNE
jgi:hypothetical protein